MTRDLLQEALQCVALPGDLRAKIEVELAKDRKARRPKMSLAKAAKWFDREYERLASWRSHMEGHDAKRLEGQLGGIAEVCAILRMMHRSGKGPAHTKPWNLIMDLAGLRQRRHKPSLSSSQ